MSGRDEGAEMGRDGSVERDGGDARGRANR